MRHIHADHMIAAANDTTIEWEKRLPREDAAGWCLTTPAWLPELEYRQRPAPHPHQAMMDQAAADPSIVWQYSYNELHWFLATMPDWYVDRKYRKKPAEPKMVDMWKWAGRGNDGMVWDNGFFYATEEEAQSVVSTRILCRIEGSKISVEVSQ